MEQGKNRLIRSSESGIAMVVTMFMVLILSLLGSSLMYVSNTETLSSLNYQTMSQVRYAAESGVHSAANHILWTYSAPGTGSDPLANYDTTVSPVRYNGAAVVLSSNPTVASNYPVEAVRTAFSGATAGTLAIDNGTVAYNAVATLMSMRQITDAFTNSPITLQTWEITGTGSVAGAGSASLEVTATIERQEAPIYKYAAFATDNGCDALKFGGGAHTNSYDSSTYGGSGTPTISNSGGNVGTNGNLNELGATTSIQGSLSTPRSGVGTCSANNVTALTQSGGATVTGGITQLSQAISYPTPPTPSPLPPTTSQNMQKNGSCPAGVPYCTAQAGVGKTITPPSASTEVDLGNVSVTGGAVLHLSAGIYVVNSISMTGNSSIVLDGSGPVIFKVAGVGQTTPIDLAGGTISNLTYSPSKLQFIYGGTADVKLAGGTASSSLVYVPNAGVTFSGGADFYGAVVAGKVKDMGGATIHYDRNLQNDALTAGNPVMDAFTWKNY